MARPTTILTFLLTLALALPAMSFAPSEAQALPGSTLSGASSNGKRTHKRAGKKKRKASKGKRSTRRVRRTTRTTRTTRPQRTAHTTRRTHHHARRRTHRHGRAHRSHVHHRRPARRSRTVVHHDTHVHRQQPQTTTRRSYTSGSRRSSIDVYLTGGLGISGLASETITDTALPGLGYNLALGFKGDWLGAEIGFNGGGYTFDPEAASTDVATVGLSADLKVQPSLGIVEPFVSIGAGAYAFNDGILDASSSGAALRLGAGLDLRFDDAALGARYLYSAYGFGDESGLYGGPWTASSETLGLNLAVYF